MNVRDIAGILSRPFIVGYFTPAIIAWATVALLTRGGHPRRFDAIGFEGQFLVVVVLSLATAALLSALRYEIRLAFTHAGLLPAGLRERLREREGGRFAKFDAADPIKLAARDVRFPDTLDRVRPTRFGNAEAAYQSYPATRFGLDYAVAWNVAAAAIGIFLFSPLFYRLAVAKEQRLGAEQRASFDVHRLELYEKFGLRRPASPEEEKLIAQWLSAVTLWPTIKLPAELWDDVGPDPADKPPDAIS